MSAPGTHPLLSCRFGNVIRLLKEYGCEPRYLPRACGIGAVTLLRQPLTALAGLRYGSRVKSQVIEPNPVFIIGHWRSGTTHFQNVMSCDPQFARVTLLQAGLPGEYLLLSSRMKERLGRFLPSTRGFDNVPLGPEVPWEEELALTATGLESFYHVSFFPKAMDRIVDRAVFFDGDQPERIEQWKTEYLGFLRSVQFTQPGKPLLLKNPANTARIRVLKQQFPGARFIFLHRNPLKVFASTVHLYLSAQQAWGFHSTSREQVVEHVLRLYPKLMNAYAGQKQALSKNELIEIGFRDFQEQPLNCLEQVYRQLNIPGFDAASPAMASYLDQQQNYRKNSLPLSSEETERVLSEWKPYMGRYGYEA